VIIAANIIITTVSSKTIFELSRIKIPINKFI